ncbi:MAG: hypothetical protein HC769_08235 [Cyanobacteria bacterium CRU_2_1]|nr:hypothetical protein [Cyanobacteria bacterium CRU_2_1]
MKLLENVPDPMMRSLPDLSQTIQCGNALIASDFYDHFPQAQSDRVNPFDWHTAFPNVMPDGFDLVIGNPPYLDSEWMTLYLPDWRQYCSSRYRTAIGNWDLFCVFIEKALALCRSGGLTSLVVPNKLVSAEYAAKARSLLSQENQLLSIRDYSQVSAFSASVYPLVYITRKSPQSASIAVYETMRDLDQVNQSRWLNGWSLNSSWLITTSSDQLCLLLRLHQNFPMLETIAHVTGAATVAEAYEIQLIIQEKSTVESGDLRLVNSGTLDRYTLLWGNKRLRYLGRSYWHPVICESECDRLPPKRYQQARQPKIIIAGMTQRLECALDETGTMLAGKSTTLIMNRLSFAIDLRYLLGLLNSRLINFYFASHFSGNRLQGNYLRVGSPQLRKIPICIPDFDNAAARHNYDRMIDLVNEMLTQHNEQIDQEIDHLVYKLYRLSDAEIELVT